MRQSWGRALGGMVGGAVVGGLAAAVVTFLAYTQFWKGGVQRMGGDILPVFLVTGSVGAMLGAAVGVAWMLSWIPSRR